MWVIVSTPIRYKYNVSIIGVLFGPRYPPLVLCKICNFDPKAEWYAPVCTMWGVKLPIGP